MRRQVAACNCLADKAGRKPKKGCRQPKRPRVGAVSRLSGVRRVLGAKLKRAYQRRQKHKQLQTQMYASGLRERHTKARLWQRADIPSAGCGGRRALSDAEQTPKQMHELFANFQKDTKQRANWRRERAVTQATSEGVRACVCLSAPARTNCVAINMYEGAALVVDDCVAIQ